MKTTILSIVFFSHAIFCFGQSIERDVVAASGDYYEGANISLSWTLGEIATETYDNGNNILTQGFQQPGLTLRIYVDLAVFLEGPFNGTNMNTSLNLGGQLPLSQPYYTLPWIYPGTESVASIPNPDIVDWLLVELRDATEAASATPSTIIKQQAAFLLKNGSVVGLDGSSDLGFNTTISNNLYVVVWHRNHLGMMSATALTESAGVYTYNFTTAQGMAYQNGQKSLNGGAYGMYAGDGDANGTVGTLDYSIVWVGQSGHQGYLKGDFNMDTQVANQDKNDFWIGNLNEQNQVPN